jgi:hypothetical protein
MSDRMGSTASSPRGVFSFFNPVAKFLLTAGGPLGPNGLITITGRKSGLPRTTPVAVHAVAGRRWAPFGGVQWVRNLRVAGRATLTMRRRQEAVRATELDPTQHVAFFRDSDFGVPEGCSSRVLREDRRGAMRRRYAGARRWAVQRAGPGRAAAGVPVGGAAVLRRAGSSGGPGAPDRGLGYRARRGPAPCAGCRSGVGARRVRGGGGGELAFQGRHLDFALPRPAPRGTRECAPDYRPRLR